MKTTFIRNDDRKTVTLALSPVTFTSAKHLYTIYHKPGETDTKKDRYFSTGILAVDYKDDLLPMLKRLASELNAVCATKDPVNVNDLINLDDEYAIFQPNKDQDGELDGNYKINLSSKAKNRHFLTYDLEGKRPVDEDDSWKKIYAIEVEFKAGINDQGEKYVYAIFHRGIVVGEKEGGYKANNAAFSGFTFAEAEGDTINDDDVPF